MRLFHYLEIENFKRFGNTQRIELEHPSVLIGPNNCGKTSAIQAISLWSKALKTWVEVRKSSSAKERTATSLNRLAIVSVPVPRTRYFWHDTRVRTANKDIPINITVGVEFEGKVYPVSMRLRNQGEDLVYCSPDDSLIDNMALLQHAASFSVHMLYPMSGLETEEPILQPGRIDVLLGQGQTAQVLRNLCLIVHRDAPDDWSKIQRIMNRLFLVELEDPSETIRGAIDLRYRQKSVKESLDLSLSGRGFQQLLLIFSYLFSHKRSVLLIDEPDAHLEILRQKQVYVLLRDIASQNDSQVILVTHSEVILEEALDTNLTLLIDGQTDDLASKTDIKNSLKHYGAAHYVKARERGYVFYVEGGTDIDMLRKLAERLNHPVAEIWDPQINSFYVQDNYPLETEESALERVEGGFGVTPKNHFFALSKLVDGLKGLAILDNDGRGRYSSEENGLSIQYWKRYEIENYIVTPNLLQEYAENHYGRFELFGGFQSEIREVLEQWTLEFVFENRDTEYNTYCKADTATADLLWRTLTERKKLSNFAEEFFRRLAKRVSGPLILRKGELHRLVDLVDPKCIDKEVNEMLDRLHKLFQV